MPAVLLGHVAGNDLIQIEMTLRMCPFGSEIYLPTFVGPCQIDREIRIFYKESSSELAVFSPTRPDPLFNHQQNAWWFVAEVVIFE